MKKETNETNETIISNILGKGKRPFERILHFTPQIFLPLVIAIIGVDVLRTGSESVLVTLSHPENARGLITLLFSIGAVWIALILVVGAFSNADEKQFNRAKEILIIMIGILGTIVGYYFGAESNQTKAQNTEVQEAPKEPTIQ